MKAVEYLTDEELEKLTSEIEEYGTASPPDYLEKEIIGRIRKERQRAENRELFVYRMKIAAAAAAAIIMIFTLPSPGSHGHGSVIGSGRQEQKAELFEKSLSEKMDEFSVRLNGSLMEMTGKQ